MLGVLSWGKMQLKQTDTEAVLVPNPAARLETFMFDNVPVDRIGLKVTIHYLP